MYTALSNQKNKPEPWQREILFVKQGTILVSYEMVKDYTYDFPIKSCFGLNLCPKYIKLMKDISPMIDILATEIAKHHSIDRLYVKDIRITTTTNQEYSKIIKLSENFSIIRKFAYEYYSISYKINSLEAIMNSEGWHELSYDTDTDEEIENISDNSNTQETALDQNSQYELLGDSNL